jgi:cytochrome c biogenesis protein CcmG/thiol:disulfide interchange protein DsbE
MLREKKMTDEIAQTVETAPPKRRIRWGRLLAWGALTLFLIILALGLLRTQQGPVLVGQNSPMFTLTTFDGQPINMKDLQGKVVVVNFWASWCKPCEQEAADLESAWQYYKPNGNVVFLGVDYVDTEPEAKGYLQKFNITYPNGADLGTRISQAYRIRGVPETYIISPQGKLAYVQIGPFESLAHKNKYRPEASKPKSRSTTFRRSWLSAIAS